MRYILHFTIWFLVLWLGVSIFSVSKDVWKEEVKPDLKMVQLTTQKEAYEMGIKYHEKHIAGWKKYRIWHLLSAEKRKEANQNIEYHETKREELQKKLQQCEEELSRVTIKAKRDLFEYVCQRLKKHLGATWVTALLLAVVMTFAPFVWRLFTFCIVAPLVERVRPFRPVQEREKVKRGPTTPSGETGVKNLKLTLSPGEELIVRDETYVSCREIGMEHRFIWLYSWRYPIMSICCKLTNLVAYKATVDKSGELSISSDDPDEYFCSLPLPPGEQLIILPSDLVAFNDDVIIRRRWCFSPHAFCYGQLRFFILCGPERSQGQPPARVVVRSLGGITKENITAGGYAFQKRSLITASADVEMSVRRTESFWNYFVGRSTLFDLRLSGSGEVRIHNAQNKATTIVDRTINVVLNAIGNLLGF